MVARLPFFLAPALGLALLAPGCGSRPEPATARPAAASSAPFRLVDVASARGIDFRHSYGSRSPVGIVETMGSGCAFVDFDRDGWQDLLLVSAGQDFKLPRQEPGTRLYRNRGDGSFEDVTARSGLAPDGYLMGCCAGDYDNDGWDDLFLTGFGRNFLYRNRGDGTFADVTRAAGILQRPDAWGMGCAFADVNRDGRLDLYVANYIVYDPSIPLCPAGSTMSGCTPNHYRTQRNELYLNRDGRFVESAVGSGAEDPEGAGLGVVMTDVDDDGWIDLYVANDGTPNALLHNQKGRFRNIGNLAGVAFGEAGVMRAGMGTDAADYDGDGRMDLVVTNFFHEPNSVYRNAGGLTFDDVSFPSGVGGPSLLRLGFGVSFVDLDQDGRQDLYVGNGHVYDNVHAFNDVATFEQLDQVMRNEGGGRFKEVTPESGAVPDTRSVTRSVSVGDIDNDGAPDILLNSLGRPARLLRNEPRPGRHWLGLKLVGRKSNRSAIGARVELKTPDGLQVREVRSGGSYLGQADFRALFGLGRTDQPAQVSVRVRWPSGEWQSVRPGALDRYLTVEEGASSASSR